MKKTLAILIFGAALSFASPTDLNNKNSLAFEEKNYSPLIDIFLTRELNLTKNWELTPSLNIRTNFKFDFDKINYNGIDNISFFNFIYSTLEEIVSFNLSFKYKL